MKKSFMRIIRQSITSGGLMIAIVMIAFTLHAQGTWTQKADFGGGKRDFAIGFSIGSKGYIGTGEAKSILYKDFWEYNPATDTWTQKADFGGGERQGAVGFSIGPKGYVGTGADQYTTKDDFWEYNPTTNMWIKKANVGGTARFLAVGFSIGQHGYIGTGVYSNFKKDFWEYDPVADAWTQKADFGGTARDRAVGFSIGSKGYIGTGEAMGETKDFWEYDPGTDAWMQKADFGGTGREEAVGFSIGNKGYIGTGGDGITFTKDFWEYDPTADAWTQKADFGGAERWLATGFSIDNKAYIGIGNAAPTPFKDFWEYTPDTSACPTPINTTAVNITTSSVKLIWDAATGAEKYKLRYEVAATNDWIVLYPVAHHKLISDLSPNTQYTWQVKTLCHADSPSVASLWSAKQHFTTASSRLNDYERTQSAIQIYPNPVQDYAAIQFTLLQSSKVIMILCDLSGKEIQTVLNDQLQSGDHSLQLNTSHFAKGVYLVRMITDDGIENQKLIIQ